MTALRAELSTNEADVRAAYRQLMVLVRAGNLDALKYRLDRAWGKIPQAATATVAPPRIVIAGLSADDAKAIRMISPMIDVEIAGEPDEE